MGRRLVRTNPYTGSVQLEEGYLETARREDIIEVARVTSPEHALAAHIHHHLYFNARGKPRDQTTLWYSDVHVWIAGAPGWLSPTELQPIIGNVVGDVHDEDYRMLILECRQHELPGSTYEEQWRDGPRINRVRREAGLRLQRRCSKSWETAATHFLNYLLGQRSMLIGDVMSSHGIPVTYVGDRDSDKAMEHPNRA